MEEQGLEGYIKHMVEAENVPLAPGPAFAFVQAIEAVNLGTLMLNNCRDDSFLRQYSERMTNQILVTRILTFHVQPCWKSTQRKRICLTLF